MMYIREFDPWKNELCTCPRKYSLNPYTGCDHACIYCYSSSYIKDFYNCRPKKDLLRNVKKDAEKIPENSLISLSNTSDPYPALERKMKHTRECLKIFKEHDFRVLVVTKSDLVLEDIDLLSDMKCAVSITITTLKFHKKLEPNAPRPERRILALKKLSDAGIPTVLRLDPLFPHLTENEIEIIVSEVKDNIEHVVSSTFKPRWDSWNRFHREFPEIAKKLYREYNQGRKLGNSWYLPEETRLRVMSRVRDVCEAHGISFACCRENFKDLHTSESCDGSHLIEK